MKIDECTPENVHTVGDGETPPCAGLTPNVLPEAQSTISAVSSHTGAVSYTHLDVYKRQPLHRQSDKPADWRCFFFITLREGASWFMDKTAYV